MFVSFDDFPLKSYNVKLGNDFNETFFQLPNEAYGNDYLLVRRDYKKDKYNESNRFFDEDAKFYFYEGDIAFFAFEKTWQTDEYGYSVYERYQGYTGWKCLHNIEGYPAVVWGAPCHYNCDPEYYTFSKRYYYINGKKITYDDYVSADKKKKK